MSAEEPYAVVLNGDFTYRSPQWWESDNENDEGRHFKPLTSDLGLHQLISGPTHIVGQSKSCIDLILTDQPNMFIESGIHPSLHQQCHYQIIYGTLSIRNPAPPPYTRKLWFYAKADFISIRKSIVMFPWQRTFEEVTHPDDQVKIHNEVLLHFFKLHTKRAQKNKAPTSAMDHSQHQKFLEKEKSCIQVIYNKGSTT